MPFAPARPCAEPGCPGRCYPGSSRCAEHQLAHARQIEAQRASAAQRGYDRDWRKRRAEFLRDNSDCVMCGAPATEVHHRVTLAAGGTHDADNLAALCKPCHSRITARQGATLRGS
jgi:5-methylcytosine-specific restriction protein A